MGVDSAGVPFPIWQRDIRAMSDDTINPDRGEPRVGALAADFRALFQSVPDAYLVLDPNLAIIAVTDAYLQATMTRREVIVGRHLFDVFPDNPGELGATGTHNLRGSLQRVLTDKIADAMAVQKYDVRKSEAEGSGFEVRYWSPLNVPVLDASGNVEYIIHRVEDVTEFVRLKQSSSDHARHSRQLRDNAERVE